MTITRLPATGAAVPSGLGLGSPRRGAGRLDWLLVACVVTLTAFGGVLVLSATRVDLADIGSDPAAYLRRHVINAVIGATLAALVAVGGWWRARLLAPLAWLAGVAGLLVVLTPMGVSVNGAQSWIALPAGFTLQPVEIVKVALVALLAVLLGRSRATGPVEPRTDPDAARSGPDARRVLLALAAVGLPAALVLLQPDVGSVTVLAAMAAAVLVVAGVRARWLVGLAAAVSGAVALAVQVGLLRDYQLARFTVFFDPAVDPLGVGYNTAQAREAIASGGLTGNGLFAGPRTQGSFVPEQETDFVFTVAGEELGFVGAGLLVVVLGLLVWRVLRIGARSPDLEGRLVAAGVAGWFGFQTFQSVGMTLGLLPVTGLPIPFVSYGGSSMFAAMIAIGLLQGVALRTPRTFG